MAENNINNNLQQDNEQLKKQVEAVKLTYDQMQKYAKAMVNTPIDKIVRTAYQKMIQKYSKETVSTYLSFPIKYENKLRELVDYLCNISPQFTRLVEYIPNMAIIAPLITQKSSLYKNKTDKKLKDFLDMCDYIDMLDIKNISNKVLKEIFK